MPAGSIKIKLALLYSALLALVLAALGFAVYHVERSTAAAKLNATLDSHAHSLALEIDEELRQQEFPDSTDLYETLDHLPGVRLLLRNANGNAVFGDSSLQPVTASIWKSALRNQTSSIQADQFGTSFVIRTYPFEFGEEIKYVIHIAVPDTEIQASLAPLQRMLFLGIPLAVLLLGLLSYRIVAAAFKPVASLTHRTRTLSANNLSQRLDLPNTTDEIRELAETLNAMLGRLEQSFLTQKQFVADASHEIRTPLTILRSELEYSSAQDRSPEEMRRSIAISLSEIEHLTRLVQNLLLLSKIENTGQHIELEEISFDEVLLSTAESLYSPAQSKDIHLHIEIDNPIQGVSNRDLVRSILFNLLDNAIKYSSSGGTVRASLTSTDSSIIFEISDTGEGMSEEELPLIFNRFYRNTNHRGHIRGTGLGLTITQQLVTILHGTLELSSKKGQGTTAQVIFPLAHKISEKD